MRSQISVLEASNDCCKLLVHLNEEDGFSSTLNGDITDAIKNVYATWLTRPKVQGDAIVCAYIQPLCGLVESFFDCGCPKQRIVYALGLSGDEGVVPGSVRVPGGDVALGGGPVSVPAPRGNEYRIVCRSPCGGTGCPFQNPKPDVTVEAGFTSSCQWMGRCGGWHWDQY